MRKLPAETIYYLRHAVWGFASGLIFTSIWVLYYTVMELSLVQVSLLFVVLTVTSLVFEIPTGILADLYSRRLSVILGGGLMGCAYVLIGSYPIFAIVLLAGFIEALGDTFISGALQAWITDEVGESQVSSVFLRGKQVATPAHWAGVVLSVALAARLNYQAPIILGGALWLVLTIVLVLSMPETNFLRNMEPAKSSSQYLSDTLKASLAAFMDGARTVRGSRTLQTLFFTMLLGSAFADGFYKFSRAHILLSFDLPTITLPLLGVLKDNLWFGLLEMLQGLFYLAGAEVVRRKIRLERTGASARTLMAFFSLMLVALFVFAFTGHIGLAMAAWVIVCGLQDLGEPIMEAWLNQNIHSKVRATVISMSGQTGEIGALGSSTGLGAFGDHFGVRSALKLLGAILLPLILIYRQNARVLPIETSNAGVRTREPD